MEKNDIIFRINGLIIYLKELKDNLLQCEEKERNSFLEEGINFIGDMGNIIAEEIRNSSDGNVVKSRIINTNDIWELLSKNKTVVFVILKDFHSEYWDSPKGKKLMFLLFGKTMRREDRIMSSFDLMEYIMYDYPDIKRAKRFLFSLCEIDCDCELVYSTLYINGQFEDEST